MYRKGRRSEFGKILFGCDLFSDDCSIVRIKFGCNGSSEVVYPFAIEETSAEKATSLKFPFFFYSTMSVIVWC